MRFRGGATAVSDERPPPRQASSALVWSFANTAVGRFGTIAIGIVLARLLGPAEFGTFAVAFVALMAILSFNELGVSLAIVRWKEDPAAIAPTVNTLSLGTSAVLTVVAVLASSSFANAMGDPGATNLVRLLSLCVLINGAVATPAALMQREFRQDQRMVVDQVNVWVGAGVSVVLALLGWGAMSLVIGRLAGASISALLFLHYSPLPFRLGLDRTYVRPLLDFGLPLAGASIIVFLVGFVDQLVVGHVLGSVMLGFYVLASNLASWPVTMFSQPLRNVAPALFARLHHDPVRMRADFRRVLRPLAAVSLPICVIISATSPDIIRFIYGTQWLPAAPILRWLAILAAFRIFFELSYDFLVVLGRSSAILTIQIVWIVCLVPALWFGVERFGVTGAGAALVLVSALISFPLYVLEFRRSHISARDIARAVWVPLLLSLLVGGLALGLVLGLEGVLVTLALSGALAAVTAGGTLWCFRADLKVFRESAPV